MFLLCVYLDRIGLGLIDGGSPPEVIPAVDSIFERRQKGIRHVVNIPSLVISTGTVLSTPVFVHHLLLAPQLLYDLLVNALGLWSGSGPPQSNSAHKHVQRFLGVDETPEVNLHRSNEGLIFK